MICTYCKKEIPEHAQVCPFCGAPVQTAAPAAPVFSGRPEAGHQPPLPNSYPQQSAVPPQVPYVPQDPQNPYAPQAPQVPYTPQAPYAPQAPQVPYTPQAPYTPQQPNQAPYAGQPGQVPRQPGYGYGPQFVPGGVPKQASKKKVRWIVLGSIAGFLVAAGALLAVFLGWYNAPTQVYERAMKAGDFETAGLQLDSLEEADRLQAIDRFTELAEQAYEDYNRGAITYEEAEELIKTLSSHCTENGLPGRLQDLKVLRRSKINFEKGVEAEQKGEDIEAFSYYDKVVEDDLQYETAQGKVKVFWASFKKDVLSSAATCAARDDYEGAINALEIGLEYFPEDEELLKLLDTYEYKAWEKDLAKSGLSPSGKFLTAEDYANSEELQEEIAGINEEGDGILLLKITGKGDTLFYSYIFTDMKESEKEYWKDHFENYLEENKGQFEEMVADLKADIEAETTVVIQFISADGTILCSGEF